MAECPLVYRIHLMENMVSGIPRVRFVWLLITEHLRRQCRDSIMLGLQGTRSAAMRAAKTLKLTTEIGMVYAMLLWVRAVQV